MSVLAQRSQARIRPPTCLRVTVARERGRGRYASVTTSQAAALEEPFEENYGCSRRSTSARPTLAATNSKPT
jgi:hypothetical protein